LGILLEGFEMDRDELVAVTAAALAAKDALKVKGWVPVLFPDGSVWEGELLEDGSFIKKWRAEGCCCWNDLFVLGVDGRVVRGVPV